MSTLIKKRSKKIGLPPGTLIPFTNGTPIQIHISVINYDASRIEEIDNISIEECLKHMHNNSMVTWINIRGVNDPHVLEAIGHHLGLHALLLEDVMSTSQRSKLDDYKDYLYIVLRLLSHDQKMGVQDQQVSLILGQNYLISFLEDPKDVFEPIKNRLRNSSKRIRTLGSDYLCYTLIDLVVDHYFSILEAVDKELEDVENDLTKQPKPQIMQQIQHLKREIVFLRKSVWPTRELINSFRRIDSKLISETTQVYMQDVYDHTIQAIDTIESLRDIASGMLDVYLSNVSLRMNDIMKVLTIVATIFVPLTFIASLYGMNFDNMPELHWKWGYPFALSMMVIVGLSMIYYFRKKRWI